QTPTEDCHRQPRAVVEVDIGQMPTLGAREGEPPQADQQDVDEEHAETCRPAGTQCQHEQEQLAVAQPRPDTADIGNRRARFAYGVGRSCFSDLQGTQSSEVQVAGGPPEHSSPAQHCSADVQASPSSAHSAALTFLIKPMPNW